MNISWFFHGSLLTGTFNKQLWNHTHNEIGYEGDNSNNYKANNKLDYLGWFSLETVERFVLPVEVLREWFKLHLSQLGCALLVVQISSTFYRSEAFKRKYTFPVEKQLNDESFGYKIYS